MSESENLVHQEEMLTPCRHHWIIESADGEMSFGKCKYCGEVKEFSNVQARYNHIKEVASRPLSDEDDLTRDSSDDE